MRANKEKLTKEVLERNPCIFFPETVDELLFIHGTLKALGFYDYSGVTRESQAEFMKEGIAVRSSSIVKGSGVYGRDLLFCRSDQFEEPYISPSEQRLMAAFNKLSERLERLEAEILPRTIPKPLGPRAAP